MFAIFFVTMLTMMTVYKEYDMITKAFVIFLLQNWSLIAPRKLISKNSQKSRDENIRLIPSRKIPGSRDFAKIPSQKSRDLNSWERWGLGLTGERCAQWYQHGIIIIIVIFSILYMGLTGKRSAHCKLLFLVSICVAKTTHLKHQDYEGRKSGQSQNNSERPPGSDAEWKSFQWKTFNFDGIRCSQLAAQTHDKIVWPQVKFLAMFVTKILCFGFLRKKCSNSGFLRLISHYWGRTNWSHPHINWGWNHTFWGRHHRF